MTPDAVRQHLARPSSLDDTQASLGDLFNIIVHTARKIGTDVDGTVKHVVADVGQTAHKIAHDVERTTETVTDDIRRGDVGGALTAAARGTLSITEDAATGVLRVGGDVVAGAAHLAGDIAVGAEQLVVATIEVLGNAVTFVLDHTGAVGRAIESVLTAIGSTIDKALDWLTSLLPLDHIFHVHDAVLGAFEPSSLDRRVTSWLDPMEAATEHVFESMDDEVKRLKATSQSELHHLPTGHSALPAHHSEGKDALDWVMSHVFHPDATSTAPPAPTDAARQRADGVHATVSGHPATSGVDASVTRSMDQVVARGLTDPSAIAPMLVDIAASVAGDALGLLRDTTHEVYTFADHVASTLADAASGAMDIPVIGAIYRAHDPGGQSPSVMGIAALGAAVPLAFAHPQSEGLDFAGAFTHVDGADANAAVELPPAPSSLEIVLTSGYIAFQTLLGLVAAIPDDRPPEIDVELTETGSARRPADTSDLSIERSAAQDIETVELVWGFGLLMCSAPTAVWTGHLDHLFENGGDPFEAAPNTWGDIMFLVQFVTYLVELVAFARSKLSAPAGGGGLEFEGRSGMQLFAGLSAALQLIGTIVITVAEIIKVDKHDNVDAGSDYAKWGHTPLGGVGMKTFGNVLGTVPSFLALAQPAGTPRTPAVRVVDVGAHVAEAAVVGVRLAQHGMY
jgi:hypothetical protein